MHSLEEWINQWRATLENSQELKVEVVDELEDHLRQKLADLQSSGLSEEEKFTLATVRLGHPAILGNEFEKLNYHARQLKQIGYMIGGYLLIDTVLKTLHVAAKITSGISLSINNISASASTIYIITSIVLLVSFFYLLWLLIRTNAPLPNMSYARKLTLVRRRYPRFTITMTILALTAIAFVNQIGFSIFMARYISVRQIGDFMMRTAVYDMGTALLVPLSLLVFLIWIIRANHQPQHQTTPQ